MTRRSSLIAIVFCAACVVLGACSLDLDALRAKDSAKAGQNVQGIASAESDAGAHKVVIDWSDGDQATGWYPASTSAAQAVHSTSCGDVGQSCCMPGNTCTSGACLRGHCTPYGGLYAETHGCGATQCSVRDPYTAGCACPEGFSASPILHSALACDGDAGTGALELVACSADANAPTTFGGAWVARAKSTTCPAECIDKSAGGSGCGCPKGAGALRLELAAEDGMCPGADASLSICIDPSATALGFGGAFITTNETKPRCIVPNPISSDCSCTAQVSAQLFGFGDLKLGVCNL